MTLASVDLGGTNIGIAIGTAAGQIVARDQIRTQGSLGPAHVLGRIAASVKRLAPTGVDALGLGVPGLCDIRNGTTLFLPNLATQWRGVAVSSMLENELGCPVYLLNDARMATLGELDYGYGRQVKDFVFLTLGTGIGGGVVLDGRLRTIGGEIGHQTIEPDGPLCGCGSRGCLEALASATALNAEGVRLIRMGQAPDLNDRAGGDLNLVTTELMSSCSDEAVGRAIERVGRYIGIGAANLVTVLHPQMVVLAGGLAQMGDLLTGPIRVELRRRVKMFPVDGVRVEVSLTGHRAGILGGLALARRKGVI